jgi:16S rRNA (adenine1518-N6/adenine1519-N6)-dimethyltransferase
MKPKKSLGQNFLTSIPARNAIVAAGEIDKDDVILEIGPGKGMLTEALLESAHTVIALEKDRELIPYLEEKFKSFIQSKKLILIQGDVLTYTPETIRYKIIANIPYYITGAIFSKFLSEVHQPTQMVVLIQKEVAERIVARDGKQSLLSLSIWAYGEPKLVYRVSKGSFNPVPKVDSAVLLIKNISKKNFASSLEENNFFTLIRAGFAHKRKLVIRNMEHLFEKDLLQNLFERRGLSEKSRAEDLSLQDWLFLSKEIHVDSK